MAIRKFECKTPVQPGGGFGARQHTPTEIWFDPDNIVQMQYYGDAEPPYTLVEYAPEGWDVAQNGLRSIALYGHTPDDVVNRGPV